MEAILDELAHLRFLNQFWLALFFLVPMVLVARATVAGTKYSPILIIVVFGLAMGFTLNATGVTGPGLPSFPMLGLLSRTTIVALVVAFFVGGQQLRKIFGKVKAEPDTSVTYASDEVVLGTGRTQFVFIVRAFFVLLGIDAIMKLLLNNPNPDDVLTRYYPFIAYFGMAVSLIFVDNKAQIDNRHRYLRKGLLEAAMIIVVLLAAFGLAQFAKQWVALPQIFFAMVIASALGWYCHAWVHGPTMRCLLSAGIPIILAANFLIGGSLIQQTFTIPGVRAVLVYGFFGQIFWMFSAIALLMVIGRTSHVRNLAPGMAGALSHAGLTGACTAGDLGEEAANRAPIMINVPFMGHIFVFSILAMSMQAGGLLIAPALAIALVGVVITVFALRMLRSAQGEQQKEVKGLMLFALGWQLTAIFGGFILLAKMALPYAAMAKSAALSHFGLFAAIQSEMFGVEAAGLITFVFAMPFLVHPFVFFLFGRAMENHGEMPKIPVYLLAVIGLLGVIGSVVFVGIV